MKTILSSYQIVKYLQIFFIIVILASSNTVHAELSVSVAPNNRGVISFLSDCNIVLSFGSDAVIDVSKLLVKLNGDDVTSEVRSLGKTMLSEDKKKLNMVYPARATDFHQGEYTFEVSTPGTAGDKATLNIQEYNGKAICVNCEGSRSISDADMDNIIEEDTKNLRSAVPKPVKMDGKCGNSNGKSFASIPDKDLCDRGTATIVNDNDHYKWSCRGEDGGRNAVCTASINLTKGTGITKPTQQSPANNAEIKTTTVTFSWSHPYNDDYELKIKTSGGTLKYASGRISHLKSKTVDLSSVPLTSGSTYKWYVVVYANGKQTSSLDRWFKYEASTTNSNAEANLERILFKDDGWHTVSTSYLKPNYNTVGLSCHAGIDYKPRDGKSKRTVYAAVSGKIVYPSKSSNDGYGTITIQSDDLFNGQHIYLIYLHLSDKLEDRKNKNGIHVNKGDPIGTTGDTGAEGFLHLHVEASTTRYYGLSDPGPGYKPCEYVKSKTLDPTIAVNH